MGRISNTIELAKSSWKVLKADKELLALPVMSAVATLIVGATFLIPMFIATGIEAVDSPGPFEYVLLFVMYVVLAFVTIFFNSALVLAAHDRMSGGDPTLGSSLRAAASNAGRILPWAIVSATVSVVLRALEERAGFLGQIVIGLVGLAWSLVTFLVLPVLVIEKVGVFDAIKRSGGLFKRTWGENVAAQIGFGLLGFLAVLPAIVVIVAAVATGSAALAVVGVVLGISWIALVSVVLSALSGIFQTALYHFAVDGEVPGGYFTRGQLDGAFAPK